MFAAHWYSTLSCERWEFPQMYSCTLGILSVVRKQRFNDLAEILDEGNFDVLPPQDKKEFIYQNKQMAKNNEKIAWSTVKNNDTVAGPSNEPAAPSPSRIPVLVKNGREHF